MATYNPPGEVKDKYYFLKNENVVKVGENWENNWCFITLAIIFGLNIIFVIWFLIFGSITKFISQDNKVESVYEREYTLAKKDDLIFDPNLNILRNEIYSYIYDVQPKFHKETKQNVKITETEKPIKSKDEENDKPVYKQVELKEQIESHKPIKSKDEENDKPAYRREEINEEIEVQDIKVEINENKGVETESNLKLKNEENIIQPIEILKTNSLLHFIFKRNIYSNLKNLKSPFNSSWKSLTKFYTLNYLLLFFCTCMFIYSGIDFDPNESISYKAIVQSIFFSILISNAAFTLINILYSSFINSSRITYIIKNDFFPILM